MEKFLHIHLLISIIFSIVLVVLGNEKSFSPLNLSYIMEARERFMSFDITKLVDPPMPSYTFSIYHRDLFEKSKFKDYDSLLENRIARSQARAKHLASILENGNANGNLTTSVQSVNGEYVGSFILGTEQIQRYLLLDSGSSLVWWQCGPCEPNKCYQQRHEPLYDLTKSKTYQQVDCLAQSTKCLLVPKVFECRQYDKKCFYDYQYADGSRTRGWIAEEVISFVLDKNQVRILFGCGGDQTSGRQFSGQFSGIAGINRRYNKTDGYGGYSLQSQFDADIMAICLPEFHSTKPSTISFHTTPFKRASSATLVTNPGYSQFYSVNLFKIFINDKEVPLFPSLSRNFGNSLNGCVVDTGSTFTIFPEDLYTEFRDKFRKEVTGAHLYNATLGNFDTCYAIYFGEVPTFPAVKMYFDYQNPENLLLLEHKRVMIYERGLACLAFKKWKQPFALLGSYQLQGIGLTFDTGTNTMSFDIDACN